MENKVSKGELLEELLRNYFLNLGYYVVRGVKYRYEGNDITDVDLFLYNRSSTLSRERINVDIKNKKSPQAFERILWANGLKKLLKFEKCIVATTDNRALIQKFGLLHDTVILDGSFISKLKQKNSNEIERFTEEEFLFKLSQHRSNKTFENKDWRYIYELSKSKLLNELDYSGFNSDLLLLQYLVEKIITDIQRREDATRFLYVIISHLLIMMDFISKDINFLEVGQKSEHIREGLNYGNLGKEGVKSIINIAVTLSGKPISFFNESFNSPQYSILGEFFSRNEVLRNIFGLAKNFEQYAYNKKFISPNNLDPVYRVMISIFLDYFEIERKAFFDSSSIEIQGELPLEDSK
ncbi:hypothetical protein [Elizabethkingia anophelis]|uniref:Uncharacterized protein n=2 Tax=Elizabethkingia anophelis TaxID=1117645 RepID=A0A455ZF87_9FLAO|nr:hypothetical protein [Elizabethkingia anophelis]ATC37773.1 hypothetical protein BAZ09_016655 [Elizabethkingia anophelis R26]ATC41453.1 hypothetical protein EAAG1_016870 [Elizabethkingia anophelis Ag1]ATC45130.1 hypothetical protein CMV41_16870 [Elizabethkingia anophelis]ATC48806.1 hypothetical protein CMV40_16870 [Elizabethkingia anophelis]ELR80758.1 hypothetical protein D505_02637 [Elizabethkingia anophelis R26]